MTPEEMAADEAAKAAASKAEAEKTAAATDPAELLKQIAVLNSENAARRIKEKEMAEQLATFNADKSAAEEKAALERGEHKEMYEKTKIERDKLQADLEAKDAALGTFLDAQIADIPEDKRVLLDHIEGIEAKLSFIAVLKAAKVFETPIGPEIRETGEFKSGTLEAQLAEAKKLGNLQAQISLKKQIFDKQNLQ